MYQLYHFPYSQHARRVVCLLEIAGLPYELQHVAMDRVEHHSEAYRTEVNPNGQVPTLVDGAVKIHESNAILRYVCRKHGLDDWYPSAPQTLARVEQWLDWNQTRLSPAVVAIVFNSVFAGENGDAAAVVSGKARLRELLPILDDGLSGSGYLAGERPTIADLSMASSVWQLGLAQIVPEERHVSRWFASISGIEGFQRSLPASSAS